MPDSSALATTYDGPLEALFETYPDTEAVAGFIPGPGIKRLAIRFDIAKLRAALDEVLAITKYDGDGFHAINLTRLPGDPSSTNSSESLSGLYWTRPDDSYREFAMEGPVEERNYREFVPELAGTYLKEVHETLCRDLPIGRMRVLKKEPGNASTWHRDPEARVHIPIVTNPGAVMIVGNHCTHMPADGSVYFTDTRAYHTAINGGGQARVHIVATLPR